MCPWGGGEWELGACGAAFHVGAELRGPEAELRPVGRNAIPQSRPTSLSPAMTTAAHGGPEGGGRGFWSFLWEESPSKRVRLEHRISISMLPGKLPSPEIC